MLCLGVIRPYLKGMYCLHLHGSWLFEMLGSNYPMGQCHIPEEWNPDLSYIYKIPVCVHYYNGATTILVHGVWLGLVL
jgi:hypothetical protein